MAEDVDPVLSNVVSEEDFKSVFIIKEDIPQESDEETAADEDAASEPKPEPEPEPPAPKPEEAPKPKEKEKDTGPLYKFNLPKKKRVQVDPTASVKEVNDNGHYLTNLPTVPESDLPYTPILYTFRVRAKGKVSHLKHLKTTPPPFYLQFDHAIAVIWTLFSKEAKKENLGIAQLQWALHFLQSIFTTEGFHPKDVQLCIDAIQDYLIELYAAMSDEAVLYYPFKYGDFNEQTNKKSTIEMSVNYALVEEKCPATSLESKESTMIDKQLLEELENVKKVVGIDSIDLTNVVSKEQVMDILQDWKKEQIEKIQEELSMLYVVEDMMKNSDSQNFGGYTDETQFEGVFRKGK